MLPMGGPHTKVVNTLPMSIHFDQENEIFRYQLISVHCFRIMAIFIIYMYIFIYLKVYIHLYIYIHNLLLFAQSPQNIFFVVEETKTI